jgi:hypothetical protein
MSSFNRKSIAVGYDDPGANCTIVGGFFYIELSAYYR